MNTYDHSVKLSSDNDPKQNSLASPATLSRGLLIFVLVLCLYAFRAGDLLRSASVAPYFIYLADAFRHGVVNIQIPLGGGYDLIRYNELWYVAQQPLPALLMIPMVSILGIHKVSDVALGVLCGALSVALGDWVLKMSAPDLDTEQRNWLFVFIALGTVHFSVSVLGTIWFLGQIVAVLFVWVFICGVWQQRPLLSGIALGLVLLARPSIVPAALLFALGNWFFCGNHPSRRQTLTFLIQLSVPLLLAAGFLGWYNAVRFGSPFEMGYLYIQEAPDIKERFLEYGNFSPAFFPENLFTATIKLPWFHLHCFVEGCPLLEPDPLGMGFLWTSPLLLYAALAFRQDKERQQNYWLVATGLLALMPALLYHNTGSTQFGYRFLLDALPFWMILVARGVQRQRLLILVALVVYSVLINWWGTTWLIELISR